MLIIIMSFPNYYLNSNSNKVNKNIIIDFYKNYIER
jgi:hypothetical protein